MVSHWNNFFLSYVMLSSTEKLTLPVGLAQLITASPVFTPGVENGLKLPLYMPELAFAGLMTMVPTLALFAYAQRYLSKGVAMGGLTG